MDLSILSGPEITPHESITNAYITRTCVSGTVDMQHKLCMALFTQLKSGRGGEERHFLADVTELKFSVSLSKAGALPGVIGVNSSTANQHFVPEFVVPKTIQCDEVNPCCVNIPYYGNPSIPPSGEKRTLEIETKDMTSEVPLKEFSLQGIENVPGGITANQHFVGQSAIPSGVQCDAVNPCCISIPYNGNANLPMNMDEFCTNITISNKNNVPDVVTCDEKHECCIPIEYSGNKSYPDQVTSCGTLGDGTHAFPTRYINGTCITDISIQTEAAGTTINTCFSAGINVDEICVEVQVNNKVEVQLPLPVTNGVSTVKPPEFTPSSSNQNPLQNLDYSPQTFFNKTALPQYIKCDPLARCCLPITYHGDRKLPPMLGYHDEDLTVIPDREVFTLSPDNKTHIVDICVTGKPNTIHRLCVQTTTNGTIHGVNLDEVCVEIEMKTHDSGSSNSQVSAPGPHFVTNFPDGTELVCKPNSVCHIPVVTETTDGLCEQVTQCLSGLDVDIHTFDTQKKDGRCITDIAVQTENKENMMKHICLSAGSHGENINFDVKATHQTEMVSTGNAKCSCVVNGKEVNIIKKKPVPTSKEIYIAAGFGAGGMIGTMVVGIIIYVVVTRLQGKKPTRNRPTSSRISPIISPKRKQAHLKNMDF
ncbi:hypothetical protein ACF0H5_005325 [Mactra antiquata]